MSFTTALLIAIAALAVGLGFACHHLLNRVHLLERAVQGGLGPPSRRLAREEFESAFEQALQRQQVARGIDLGLVLVLGEDETSREIAAAVPSIAANRPVTTLSPTDDQLLGIPLTDLGITVRPFALLVDEGQIRFARPLATSGDLVDALRSDRNQL